MNYFPPEVQDNSGMEITHNEYTYTYTILISLKLSFTHRMTTSLTIKSDHSPNGR